MTFEVRNGVSDAAEELVPNASFDEAAEVPAKVNPAQELGTEKSSEAPTNPFEGFGSFAA